MADITFNGMTMEFSVVENMMDADVKSEIEGANSFFTEQAFLDAYMLAHKEKFGENFLQS